MGKPRGRDDACGKARRGHVDALLTRLLHRLTRLFRLSPDDDWEGRQW